MKAIKIVMEAVSDPPESSSVASQSPRYSAAPNRATSPSYAPLKSLAAGRRKIDSVLAEISQAEEQEKLMEFNYIQSEIVLGRLKVQLEYAREKVQKLVPQQSEEHHWDQVRQSVDKDKDKDTALLPTPAPTPVPEPTTATDAGEPFVSTAKKLVDLSANKPRKYLNHVHLLETTLASQYVAMRRHKVDLLHIRKSKDKLKELLKVVNLEYETLLGERAAVYGKNDIVVADYLDYRAHKLHVEHHKKHHKKRKLVQRKMRHLEERESLLKRTEERVTRQHEVEREFHIRHSRPEAGTQELRVKREEVMTRVLSNLHISIAQASSTVSFNGPSLSPTSPHTPFPPRPATATIVKPSSPKSKNPKTDTRSFKWSSEIKRNPSYLNNLFSNSSRP